MLMKRMIGGMFLDIDNVRGNIVNASGVVCTANFNAAGYANYDVSDMCGFFIWQVVINNVNEQ